jgi:hypothetical protein
VLWHLLKYGVPYDPQVWAAAEEKLKRKKLQRLHQKCRRPRLQTHLHRNHLAA